MKSKFQHVALIGKYQAVASGASAASSRSALQAVARFLDDQGCDVALEKDTARNMGMTDYPALSVTEIGAQCDLGLVVQGTARIVQGGAPRLLQELAHRYMGSDVVFPAMPNPPEGYVMHITPDRFGGVGPWND